MLPTPELKVFCEQIIWNRLSGWSWFFFSLHQGGMPSPQKYLPSPYIRALAESPTYHRQNKNQEVLQPKRLGNELGTQRETPTGPQVFN